MLALFRELLDLAGAVLDLGYDAEDMLITRQGQSLGTICIRWNIKRPDVDASENANDVPK